MKIYPHHHPAQLRAWLEKGLSGMGNGSREAKEGDVHSTFWSWDIHLSLDIRTPGAQVFRLWDLKSPYIVPTSSPLSGSQPYTKSVTSSIATVLSPLDSELHYQVSCSACRQQLMVLHNHIAKSKINLILNISTKPIGSFSWENTD